MINQSFIDGLTGQLNQLLAGQPVVRDQIRQLLQSSFSKLDLVTREEFDAQRAVLQRTREKVEALEAQLTAMQASDPTDT